MYDDTNGNGGAGLQGEFAPDARDARTEILTCVETLWEPGAVGELRVLGAPRCGTVSGYFDNPAAFVAEALRWDGRAKGVYLTLNPVQPSLLARSANHATEGARRTTSDDLVLRRRWLLIDCDAVRPSGISSTAQEHAAALSRARAIRNLLVAEGWPADAFVLADSGNGGHVLVRIDLPNDVAATTLVGGVLAALNFRFDDAAVTVDTTVGNAARISKCYGTLVCKGSSTVDRPHRRSRILERPECLTVVPTACLEALAATAPRAQAPGGRGRPGASPFDLEAWLTQHQVPVVTRGPWKDGQRYVLNPCPWNPTHTNRSAYVVQFANGAVSAGCHHSSCRGNDWHALRDLYEPGWRDAQPFTVPISSDEGDGSFSSFLSSPQWPQPLAAEAFYGLAGDFCRLVAPHTESDPAAIWSCPVRVDT
jgi:hypothetical protein